MSGGSGLDAIQQGVLQSYLKAFHLIFKLSEHEAHYKMMMGDASVELQDFAVAVPATIAAEEAPAA